MNEGIGDQSRSKAHGALWLSLVAGTLFGVVVVLYSSPEFNLPGASCYSWPADHGC